MNDWKRGMPPGKYYDGMTDDYAVYFSPGGVKWHRKRTPEEKAAHMDAMKRIAEVNAKVFGTHADVAKDNT